MILCSPRDLIRDLFSHATGLPRGFSFCQLKRKLKIFRKSTLKRLQILIKSDILYKQFREACFCFPEKTVMREWLSGRASPCQGERREFESRFPLHRKTVLRLSFFWLYVKCWGVEYKISQYNISGSQDLFVSRSIKEYVF